jgi:hypothetical protein
MRRLHVLAAFLGTLMACKTVSAMTCGSVGNGGGGGFINYDSENGVRLKEALRNGFAASSTDTGHRGNNDDFSFARGHREQGIDYHYRAIHETELAVLTEHVKSNWSSITRTSLVPKEQRPIHTADHAA